MGLHATYWDELLKLLGLMIVADDKVYQEEVEAFTVAAQNLQKSVSPDMFMTKKMAFDWFMTHRDRLKTMKDDLGEGDSLKEIVGPLVDLPQKNDVLRAMIIIAVSDDTYHSKEKLIIEQTARYWDIDAEVLDTLKS